MNRSVKMKESSMEKKLLALFHEDGILDLIVGIIVLMFGFVTRYEIFALIGLIAIPGIFYFPLKERLTYPRIGLIRFNSEKENLRKFQVVFLFGVVLLAGLILFLFINVPVPSTRGAFFQNYSLLIFITFFGGVIYAVGIFLKNARFHYYSVLWLALIFSSVFFDFELGFAMIGLGGVMLGVSGWLMVKFVRKYDLNEGIELDDENE